MNRNVLATSLLLAMGALGLAPRAAGQGLPSQRGDQGLRYLAETEKNVDDAVKGLSSAQWKFKPAPSRWSIAEVAERLVWIEGFVGNILPRIGDAPARPSNRDVKATDATIVEGVSDRSAKAQAPLDGYVWILTVAAHSARHTKQTLEVKADLHFPANYARRSNGSR